MVKKDLVEEVIEVKSLDDRMMKIAMVCYPLPIFFVPCGT
mgnify:CR=1 FL=1